MSKVYKGYELIKAIADERDKIKQEYDRDTHILQNQLDLANAKNIEKDKIIDLMSGKIYEEGIVWDNKEEVKQYFENKAKEK